jgi:hypothetical protein
MRAIDKPHRSLGKVGMRLWRDVLDSINLDDTTSREFCCSQPRRSTERRTAASRSPRMAPS